MLIHSPKENLKQFDININKNHSPKKENSSFTPTPKVIQETVELKTPGEPNVTTSPIYTSLGVFEDKGKKKSNPENGIIFIGGFNYFGLTPKESDGLYKLSKSINGSNYYSWDQKEDILHKIKQLPRHNPLILVGHSFGADTAVELSHELDSLENKFRPIDLLVTLDLVGLPNEDIPKNVQKNINYIGDNLLFFNGSAHLAQDEEATQIINKKWPISHAKMDEHKDIQRKILQNIDDIIGNIKGSII